MIGSRLRKLRLDAGMNQVQFAAIAQTTKQYVSQLEAGRNKRPNPEFIERWAKHFRVRMEWITTGKEASEAGSEGGTFTEVPECAPLAAGAGDSPLAASSRTYAFRSDSIARRGLRADTLRVFKSEGDLMLPRVRPNDAILFDQNDIIPAHGKLYAMVYAGHLQVRRALVLGTAAYFTVDNPHPGVAWTRPIAADDPDIRVRVMGRVRWIGSWED